MSFPTQGRIAGVDFGEVRIGIAICDPTQRLASPLENYSRRSREEDAQHFQLLVDREQIVGFVVGLPLFASGDESQKSREARQFGAWLEGATGCPVQFFDERYSTVAAEQILTGAGLTSKKRKQRRDMLAAHIILASFLESQSRGATPPGPLTDESTPPQR